jgi:outer membrane protein OmpA-like peptidoglycan-associated protein/ABC-type nitrate/sulfonate/bicarbonate transport system substrate-binding protein
LVLGLKYATPHVRDYQQKSSSDARTTQGTLTILVDNWVGYAPLCSLAMRSQMKRAGWNLQCEDDKADYVKRMERLKDGSVQFAVGTVDTDILTGAKHAYPGVITGVIDESMGADALLCVKAKYQNLDALKGASTLKIAYTPNSPSHHFVKAIADHFGIPEVLVKGTQRVETAGSSEAMKELLEGKVDCAVVWEPDVSKTLERGAGKITKLLGTESTKRLIVDVFMANRTFADKSPEIVELIMGNYFLALKTYRDDPSLLKKEVMEANRDLSADKVETMLKGVRWVTLEENAEQWFGVSSNTVRGKEGVIATIESTISILIAAGDFTANPLPSKDPYRLINSEFVRKLSEKGVAGFTVPGARQETTSATGLDTKFALLTDSQWVNLREVGTLRVEPVPFQRGSDELALKGKEDLDAIAVKLKHYPAFRILVKGHTGFAGDPVANQELSQSRAESVARYLAVTYGVSDTRVRAVGLGSTEPPKECVGKFDDQNCAYIMPRVEVLLVKETL